MSEEEKKAIEYWKRDIDFYHYNYQLASEYYAKIILNLIEKQQKEIEELKKEHKIMKRIIIDNGLWETLLNDDEFVNYLEEN